MTADASYIPAARAAAYPRRAGNRVQPLVDGVPAFRRICAAVEAARRRVWVTVAFLDHDLRMPDDYGNFFDVLDRAAARGVDVRVLFWREPELATQLPGSSHFAGTDAERAWLAARGAGFAARWDHVPRYCHHQKSWIVDAGELGELAFVGGINLDRESMVLPGHAPLTVGASTHDVYLEVRGPATTDVVHNFVQRWNEASERARPDGCWPHAEAANDLPMPTRLAARAGNVPVQITRTIRAGCYAVDRAAPDAAAFRIADGEQSVLEQYVAAIDAARRTLYLENQFFLAPAVVDRLGAALERGVQVLVVVPAVPMTEIAAVRNDPRAAPFFELRASLGTRPGFTLAGLTACPSPGTYADVYVHAKMLLVDDAWGTVGSTNVMNRSFHGDTELNASFWSADAARGLRVELLREHLGVDTSDADDLAALRRFAETARANRDRRARGEALQGLAIALDPATYAG